MGDAGIHGQPVDGVLQGLAVVNDLIHKRNDRHGQNIHGAGGKELYDLIVGMYMHEYLNRNAAKVVAALKPGGMLVVEGIQWDINKANLTGDRYGYKNNELPKIFSRLRMRYYEDTVAQADWDRSGRMPVPVVRFIGIKEAK